MSNEMALEVDHLDVCLDHLSILKKVSFSIPKGKLVGLLGPNGAGKTTLIKSLLGIVKPCGGEVRFFGLPLKQMRHRVAYVPQIKSVDWNFPITVFDLVLMGRYGKRGLFRRMTREDRAIAKRWLERVGMGVYANTQINALSGGQKQRIFLARALAQEAEITFLDEPTAGVDQPTIDVIHSLFLELKAEGKTLFVVHHDLDSASSLFDWVVLLNQIVIEAGPVSTVFCPDSISRTFGSYSSLKKRVDGLIGVRTDKVSL